MGFRPADWTPLADSDPVPGRPGDIRTEAGRLTRVADSIRDQVAALNRVANADQSGVLKGQYAGKIASTAKDLSGNLGKAENRYRVASGELSSWADELESAQGASLRQLQDAQTAQHDITANTQQPAQNPGTQTGSSSGHPTPPAPDPAQQARLKDAHDRLSGAQSALSRIVGTLQSQASGHAAKIRAVSKNDGLKDSRWDKFKGWVDSNARWISDACNVLGWIATACAIVALFIPGLNIIAAIALGATFLSLMGHSMLAASGDGSWFDVGMDAFALVTLGVGGLAADGAKVGEEGLEATLKGAGAMRAGEKAFDAAVDADPELAAAYKAVDNPALSDSEKAFNWLKIKDGYPAADAARESAQEAVIDLAKKDPASLANRAVSAVAHGDQGLAASRGWVKTVSTAMSDDPEIVSRASKLYRNLGTVGWTWRLGAGADTVDKSLGAVAPYLGWQGYYNTTRNPFYEPIGATW